MHSIMKIATEHYSKENMFYTLRSDLLYVVNIMALDEERNLDRLYSFNITRDAVNAYLSIYSDLFDIMYDNRSSSCYKGTIMKARVKQMLEDYSYLNLGGSVSDILGTFYTYLDKRVGEISSLNLGFVDAETEEDLKILFAGLGFSCVSVNDGGFDDISDEVKAPENSVFGMFNMLDEYGSDRYFVKTYMHTLVPNYRFEYDSGVPMDYLVKHLRSQWENYSRSMKDMYVDFGVLFPAQ